MSQSESLTSDGFLNRYKNDLKKYKLSKPKDLGSLTQNNKNQLDRIRNTVIRNIDFFMKFSPKKSENLADFANRNGKNFKKFSKREIGSFKKLLQVTNNNSSSDQQDILTSGNYITVSNCNLCPSLANSTETKKSKKDSNYEFASEWSSKINLQKVAPIWDFEGVKKHWQSYHGANAITHG